MVILTYQSLFQSEDFVCKHAFESHNVKNLVHCVVSPNYSNIPEGKRKRKSIGNEHNQSKDKEHH